MTRYIGESDVIMRDNAIDTFTAIAQKLDAHRAEILRAEIQDVHDYWDLESKHGEHNARETILQRQRERYLEFSAKAVRLMHGLSYMLESAKGGSVTKDAETSLVGSGRLTVGLIDHGDQWAAHS